MSVTRIEPKHFTRFQLVREEDEGGVSGTGVVAEVVEFSTGKAVVSWLTDPSSVTVFDSMDAVNEIHGHGGRTKVVWLD